jgi:uncharacterized protein (TIGR02266 family)
VWRAGFGVRKGLERRMASGGQQHILVIEESRILRDVVSDLLAQEGYKVTAMDAGLEVRQVLDRPGTAFDLIVVNLQVSPVSTFDPLEWLREARLARRLATPILAITGPTGIAVAVNRLRGLEAAGVQDTRTLWDQLAYRVRALLNPKEPDQRAAVRTPSGLPVNVRAGAGAAVQGVIGNISRVGMFVKLERPPAPGQEVQLQFILPDIPRLFEVQARVVWSVRRDAGVPVPGMGVEFTNLDAAGAGQINAFVRVELERFSAAPPA